MDTIETPADLTGTWTWTGEVVDHKDARVTCGLCGQRHIRYGFMLVGLHGLKTKTLECGSSCVLRFAESARLGSGGGALFSYHPCDDFAEFERVATRAQREAETVKGPRPLSLAARVAEARDLEEARLRTRARRGGAAALRGTVVRRLRAAGVPTTGLETGTPAARWALVFLVDALGVPVTVDELEAVQPSDPAQRLLGGGHRLVTTHRALADSVEVWTAAARLALRTNPFLRPFTAQFANPWDVPGTGPLHLQHLDACAPGLRRALRFGAGVL